MTKHNRKSPARAPLALVVPLRVIHACGSVVPNGRFCCACGQSMRPTDRPTNSARA